MIAESKISVVIPVLENLEYTKKCLVSLITKSVYLSEIILVENEKAGNTAKWVLENIKGVNIVILYNGTNRGVAASWNDGIKAAKNNIVCVINNDVEVYTGMWDEVLLNQWSNYKDAAVFCPWPSGSESEALHENNEPMQGLNGSCFFLKKNLIRKTENYLKQKNYIDVGYEQAYWEDADLLVQIRKAGYEGYVTPKVKTVHYCNQTAGKILPRHKGLDNPYWKNLERFNQKYGVYIWDYFEVYMSNVYQENTHNRLI